MAKIFPTLLGTGRLLSSSQEITTGLNSEPEDSSSNPLKLVNVKYLHPSKHLRSIWWKQILNNANATLSIQVIQSNSESKLSYYKFLKYRGLRLSRL
jgi:hypothetical protein